MNSIRIYDLHELDDLPKPEWLIDGALQRNTVAVLAATQSAYKTFLAIDWGMHVALGLEWNGRKVVQGNVLHLMGEGGAGVWVRTKAWRLHNQIEFSRPAPWRCTITGVNLIDEDSVTDLASAALLAFPDGVELLVVDTLARNQQGDENSAQHMGTLIRHVDALRDTLGCTVLILHHFNKGGTFRGSTALTGAFDTVILMEREGDISTVTWNKQKDASDGWSLRLHGLHVDVPGSDDGSLVLELDNTNTMQMIVQATGEGGERGLTRSEIASRVPFTDTVFEVVWQQAVDAGVIHIVEGLNGIKGTLWARNLAAIEFAA